MARNVVATHHRVSARLECETHNRYLSRTQWLSKNTRVTSIRSSNCLIFSSKGLPRFSSPSVNAHAHAQVPTFLLYYEFPLTLRLRYFGTRRLSSSQALIEILRLHFFFIRFFVCVCVNNFDSGIALESPTRGKSVS